MKGLSPKDFPLWFEKIERKGQKGRGHIRRTSGVTDKWEWKSGGESEFQEKEVFQKGEVEDENGGWGENAHWYNVSDHNVPDLDLG